MLASQEWSVMQAQSNIISVYCIMAAKKQCNTSVKRMFSTSMVAQ
jgi:hypothetical protein